MKTVKSPPSPLLFTGTVTMATDGNSSMSYVSNTISLPVFEVLSEQEKKSSRKVCSDLRRRGKKVKSTRRMEEIVSAEVHSSPPKSHRSSGKSKSHSKHEHKCHKAKHKSKEFLLDKIDELRRRNHLLNKKVNLSAVSVDSGLSQTEELSPFEMNVAVAYRHVKTENDRLRTDIDKLIGEGKEMRALSTKLKEENDILREDVLLMKNLVYKLNVELEKYQNGNRKQTEGERKPEKLPKNYEKNFLKPVLPLLKAYSETIQEKEDIIRDLESEYKRFNMAFNDLLNENEKLYVELEKKLTMNEGGFINEVKVLKKDLEMAKQENNLLFQQIKLEKEKLVKVHSMFKVKVEEVSRERKEIGSNMEECKADLYTVKGKYTVLKQEFERLKMDNDTRVPLAVHSASVNECRKLFQELKSEYENEKLRLTRKIKEQEELLKQTKEEWAEEKKFLEKSNFNQNFEIESLRRKITELENELEEGKRVCDGGGPGGGGTGKHQINVGDKRELIETRKQLRDSNKRVEELSSKLSNSKKQLRKAMAFAEDIVRGQESLLIQLHEKQKENTFMSNRFGTLRNQIKDVERGAQEELNSVEEKIRSLESENHDLIIRNKELEILLAEKEEIIRKLEPTKDSTS